MSDQSEPSDSLLKFLETRATLPKEAKAANVKFTYCPYEIGDRESRYLEIRFPFPKMSVCLPYGQLAEINGEWRLGRSIILTFSRSPFPVVVKIDGENLHDLYDALKQGKAVAIAEYDPVEHYPVLEKGQIIIKAIAVSRAPPQPASGTG